MKEWLKVGSLPDDNELSADLKAVDYGYAPIVLEAIVHEYLAYQLHSSALHGIVHVDVGLCCGDAFVPG